MCDIQAKHSKYIIKYTPHQAHKPDQTAITLTLDKGMKQIWINFSIKPATVTWFNQEDKLQPFIFMYLQTTQQQMNPPTKPNLEKSSNHLNYEDLKSIPMNPYGVNVPIHI